MLAIKLRRKGKKHQASFRVVVAEKRSKLGGKFVDDLGWLNPHEDKFDLKKDKVEHWLKVGAKPTHSVHNLLVRAGIIDEPKIAVHGKKKRKKEEGVEGETKPEAGAGQAEVKAGAPAAPPAADKPADADEKTEEKEEKAEEKPKEEIKPEPEEAKPEEAPKKEEEKPKVES